MNKSEIRKKILRIRKKNNLKNFKINPKSLFRLIKKNKIKGRVIGGYYPHNNEIDILNILKKFEKKKYQISLPKIKKKNQMNFFKWSFKEPLTINKFGIPEPVADKILSPDILLIPLVAFDENLNRLGYGGGYYDRFLSKIKKKKIYKIGLAFFFQKVKKIPVKSYDIKLDFIITNRKS